MCFVILLCVFFIFVYYLLTKKNKTKSYVKKIVKK